MSYWNLVMQEYKKQFIELALNLGVLKFGEFKLKSGRISPYFFNAGLFNTGMAASKLGNFYAEAIMASNLKFDMLFGPAYKGIPLATLTASSLAENHNMDVPYSFNRKEAKAHGEGGKMIGAPLAGNILIIDDVITAGTAVREAYQMISNSNANIAGLVISLDRQERGKGRFSAVQELEQSLKIPIVSIITLKNMIDVIKDLDEYKKFLNSIINYQKTYGIIF